MPTVNTLVVDRAELLGLGQLHQIGGRVGQSGQRAYAYLFHPACNLTEEAMRAAQDHRRGHRAGSGFKIAMRDLEIGVRATCSAPASRATSPRWATTCAAGWSARWWPS